VNAVLAATCSAETCAESVFAQLGVPFHDIHGGPSIIHVTSDHLQGRSSKLIGPISRFKAFSDAACRCMIPANVGCCVMIV
jgi:hypothetical protein